MSKYLFIGLGNIGQRHLRNLREVEPEAEIYAFRELGYKGVLNEFELEEGNIAEAYNLEYEYNSMYWDLDSTLDAHHYDAVFICNPSHLHLDYAIAVAEKGYNIFVEKPLGNKFEIEKLHKLQDLVKRKGIVFAVGFQMRFHPCLQRLKELVDRGQIGRIINVYVEHGSYMPNWFKDRGNYKDFYASKKSMGGGVALSQIHEIDYIHWIFGVQRVMASIEGNYCMPEIDVEDNITVLIQGKSNEPITLHLDFIQKETRRVIHVTGESGRVVVDLQKGILIVNDGTVKHSYTEWNDLFKNELLAFLSAVWFEDELLFKSLATIKDGIESLKLACIMKGEKV